MRAGFWDWNRPAMKPPWHWSAAPLQGQPQGQLQSQLQGQSQTALQGGQVLAERLASQTPLHSLYGGVVPEIAARAHTEILPLLAQEVLAEARRKTEQKNRTPRLCRRHSGSRIGRRLGGGGSLCP